jgi:ADP-heptose:LPS heptosyltransferase
VNAGTAGAPVLAVRLDSAGDVLVTGPAIRALAARGDGVVVLAGPHGSAAGGLLPGVDEVLTWDCPWIAADPAPVDPAGFPALLSRLRRRGLSEAVVFTSFHQSALPTALLLRMAGIGRVTAISEDYPGSLLDVRVAPPGDIPEPERALLVAEAAGFALPPGDDGRLAVRADLLDDAVPLAAGPYVVLHPGAAAPARTWPERRWEETAESMARRGITAVVTGGPGEVEMCARIARHGAIDLSGSTPLVQLARVLRGAAAVVVANTGPAHLAAAVGTPVVSLFSPVVPAARWAPYGVPVELLGDQQAPCRATRSRECPVLGHPCLTHVTADDVIAALERLVPGTLHDVADPESRGGIA